MTPPHTHSPALRRLAGLSGQSREGTCTHLMQQKSQLEGKDACWAVIALFVGGDELRLLKVVWAAKA